LKQVVLIYPILKQYVCKTTSTSPKYNKLNPLKILKLLLVVYQYYNIFVVASAVCTVNNDCVDI